MKLRKGDKVIVLSGKDKGRSGEITKVLPAINKVIVEGINTVKRAYKPSANRPQGGFSEEQRPIAASKVAIIHPTNPKRSSRIGYIVDKAGNKQRVYRQAANKVIK